VLKRSVATAVFQTLVAGLVVISPASAQGRPPGSDHSGPAFTFHRVLDDVYLAVGTGNLAVGANAAIIINEDDVLLVDSHVSPAAATVLLEELEQLTSKPVRYVVNTHFHFDHAHGNQIYPSTVEIIGHEFTREMLASGASRRGRSHERFIGSLPRQIAELKARLDTTTAVEQRTALERQIRIQENYRIATDAVRPVAPTVTMSQRLTLHRGGREIRLEFFGRGHTGGDIVVYLPAERVLVTGDLLSAGIPYMGDGYVPDWIETLERLKALDFDVILPGHGLPFREKDRIDHLQSYLADFWTQVAALRSAGVPAEEAAQRIDMRTHASNYSTIQAVGVNLDAVLGAYEVLAGAR
jgi:glyoxylase-like metal-dependent hydrolase (beta-lactamase superfamily II)